MIKKQKKYTQIALLWVLLFVVTSACTTVPYQPEQNYISSPLAIPPLSQPALQPIRHDVCHVVAPLETVWRIGKMYDVSVDSIIRTNGLNTRGDINKGQKLVIPKAAPWKPVIALYRSNKWKYIIIHHSATDYGSALAFDKAHLNRGFWNGLGYHFVIDNGTNGKADGQIEVSPRWIKQQNGAHCKAGNMNSRAIGICIVGDYTTDHLSSQQMDSLVYLVKKLKDYYNIPNRNIMGHGQVPGASTECPGRSFPWNEFWRNLS